MGGKGSGRWREHDRAPLVEEAPCIDLAALRRGGVLDAPGKPVPLNWSDSRNVVAAGTVEFRIADNGSRGLLIRIALRGVRAPFTAALELVPYRPHYGGARWFLRCPEDDCRRRAMKLYVEQSGSRIACRGACA